MTEVEMISRTKQFALRILRLVDALPRRRSAQIIAQQLGRSGTSVGANYRAACRGRSKAEFYAKLGIVEEEADESACWLELIIDSELIKAGRVQKLLDEARELVAIAVASRRTVARSLHSSSNRKSQIKNRKSL
jgi:four helix bundle protein